MRVFIVVVLLCWSNLSQAEPYFITYEFPMYVAGNETSDFKVSVAIELYNKPSLMNSSEFKKTEGGLYLTKLASLATQRKKLSVFLNEKVKGRFSVQDLDLLYPRMQWFNDLGMMTLVGHAQVGSFFFYLVSTSTKQPTQIKMIALEKIGDGYSLPSISEDNYRYILTALSLMKNIDGNEIKNISKVNTYSNCIVKHDKVPCSLYIDSHVIKYSKKANYSDDVSMYFDSVRDFLDKRNNNSADFFLSTYGTNNDRVKYLSGLVSLEPFLTLEFENSIVTYLSESKPIPKGEMRKTNRIVRFKKHKSGLKVFEPYKFNMVDTALSSSGFITSLEKE